MFWGVAMTTSHGSMARDLTKHTGRQRNRNVGSRRYLCSDKRGIRLDSSLGKQREAPVIQRGLKGVGQEVPSIPSQIL